MSTVHSNFISSTDLAKYLGISPMGVLKRIWAGKIQAQKIGRSYAISKKYIQKHFPDFPLTSANTDDYCSVMEAAKILNISRVAVFKRIKKGQLTAKKVGRHYVIAKTELVFGHLPFQTDTGIPDTPYLSVPELARLLGVSRFTVFKRIKNKSIKAHKVGRHYVVTREDVPTIVQPGLKITVPVKEYLSVAETARKLGVSRVTVFNRIRNGKIRAVRMGRSYAIPAKDIN